MSYDDLLARVEALEAADAEQAAAISDLKESTVSKADYEASTRSSRRKSLEADLQAHEGVFKITGFKWSLNQIGKAGK